MRLLWHENSWDDYMWWQSQDKKTLKRINLLIRDMQRSPFEGIGKPEPLKEFRLFRKKVGFFSDVGVYEGLDHSH